MPDFTLGAPFGMSDPFLVTFLFVLAVIFGVLELTNVFKNRAVSLIIALALSFFAASQAAFTSMLFSYLPSVTWFFIVVFFIAFVFEILGVRKGKGGDFESAVVGGGVLLVLFSVGWMLLKFFPVDIPYIGGGQNLIFLAGLIIILGLFWGAMKTGPGGKQAEGQG